MDKYRNILILFLLLFSSFSSQGCFYLPQTVPNINGIILKDGKAISGVTVRFISVECRTEDNNGKVKSECKTDTDGSFEIVGKKSLGIMLPVPAEYIICWKLCFHEYDATLTCWDVESDSSGPPHLPEYIEVECDLNSKNVCKIIESSDEHFRYRLAK